MNVDIYIREVGGSREIRIPWLPDAINVETGEASMASCEILNLGEVATPTGVGLNGLSWESIFPGEGRKTDTGMLRGEWKSPTYYHDILQDWKKKGTELHILILGYPFNHNVYLQNFTFTASGGFGDLEYSLSFKEARKIVVTSSRVASQSRPYKTTDVYTVKQGDTLWSIAETHLGAGSKWTIIYNANLQVIESVARSRWRAQGIERGSDNGKWIFPGTVLKITQR